MSRDLTAGMASGIIASTVRPFITMEFTTTVSTIRHWSGIGPLVIDGDTYLGSGDLISLSPIEDNDDLTATGVTVNVSGASIDAISMSLSELRTGQPGLLKLGLFDDAGAVIVSPKTMFRGRLDNVAIVDKDPEKPILALSFESQMIDFKRAREWRLTDQHQRQLFDTPTDTSMRFVSAVQEATLAWGWR